MKDANTDLNPQDYYDARMCYITSKTCAEVLSPTIIPLAQRLSFGVIIVIPAQSWNAMVFVDERFYY